MNKRNATDHMRKTFAFALWKAHHEIGMVHLENDDLQQLGSIPFIKIIICL